MGSNGMIELHNVSKQYGKAMALAPLSLNIERGKTTALIGPSGCGKSTLLRLIVGLIPPTTGEVVFDGQTLTPENAVALRRRMGYVIQDGGLFPHLTAEQNVLLMAKHLKMSPEETSKRVQRLCALTRFPAEGLRRYPVELSGGQRQRVGLMRALVLDPDVLLLDEPMGALDPMVRAELQEELKTIFTDLNQTVILVTHDMGEAAYLGNHIVLLSEGRVVQQGTLDDLRLHPADPFVSAFLNAQRSLVPL